MVFNIMTLIYKQKVTNKVMRHLIITLLSFCTLSFVGCSNDDDNDNSGSYSIEVINQSGFDWYNFRAVCSESEGEDSKVESREIGNVKIGGKASFKTNYPIIFFMGKDANGKNRSTTFYNMDEQSHKITVSSKDIIM